MEKIAKKSLAALVLAGLSHVSVAGVEFSIAPGSAVPSSIYSLDAPEVANDGTVLAYIDSEWQTWKEGSGVTALPGTNSGVGIYYNHLSNNADYLMFRGVGSNYNYHTPSGSIQRGRSGFEGRVIRQMSGNGKRLIAPASHHNYVSFYEDGGRYQESDPQRPDYIVSTSLHSDTRLRLPYTAVNETGDRLLVSHGAQTYFMDVEGGSGYNRSSVLTEIPHAFSKAIAISDDGSSVLGTIKDLSPGCDTSNVVYHESNGLTEIGCSDELTLIGFSGDGSKVIGYTGSWSAPDTSYIWDQVSGLRDLKDVLAQNGHDIGGWATFKATDISQDGLKITGGGTDESGENRVFLMEVVAECTADF